MSKFDKNFNMKEQDVIEYVMEKLDFFDKDAELTCKEIGDGNINYVFRVEDKNTKKSVIVKHSDTLIRSSQTEADTDHNRIEAEILRIEGELAPGFVPEVYWYDPVMCCIVMEDLKDYKNMRYAMIAHETFPTFADDISTFLAETLIRTTDNIMEPDRKKEWVKQFINPTLCNVTERLVYTEPYTNRLGRNELFELNKELFEAELYRDEKLHLEVAKLKDQFKSKAQSLIHGDLHTGSIFVKQGLTKILDPEFAFYGPAGYDIGNVIANLLFAWANAEVIEGDLSKKQQYQAWVEKAICEIIDLFKEKALKILKEQSTDRMAQTEGFAEWYVADILADTAGVAGLECIRRIVGSAKVKDITGIEDPNQRAKAEKICVLSAKEFIMNRNHSYQCGSDYVKTFNKVTQNIDIC